MSGFCAPYLLPHRDRVVASLWKRVAPDGEGDLPEELEMWDYQTKLHLKRSISVNCKEIRDDCKLGEGAGLMVLVHAKSTHSGVRHAVWKSDCLFEDYDTIDLAFVLDGGDLGGRLDLLTQVILARPVGSDSLAPHRPGSVLWSDESSCLLEGSGSQFPTDAFSFREIYPFVADARWKINVETADVTLPFASVVRLELNTDWPVIQRLLSGESNELVQEMGSLMCVDVIRQVLFLSLSVDDLRVGEERSKALRESVDVSLLGMVCRWAFEIGFGSPADFESACRDDLISVDARIQHNWGKRELYA